MRKFYTIIALLALAISFSACQKEDKKNIETQEEGLTLKAYYDGATKSTENAGAFAWLASDKIKIYTTAGTGAEFTLTSGAGTKSAEFTTSETGITVSQVAVSPSVIYSAVNEGTKTATVKMPTYYYYVAGDTQAPMLAAVTEGNSSKLSFKHIGAVVKITCSDIPADAKRITLWTSLRRITGDFDINYSNIGTDAIQAEELSSGFGSLSIYFTPTGSDMTFYFPVPTGTYPELRFVMYSYDGSYKEIGGTRKIFKPAAGIQIERGDLINAKPSTMRTNERTDWKLYYEGLNGTNHQIKTVALGTDNYVMYVVKKALFETTYNSNALTYFQAFGSNPTSSFYGVNTILRANSSYPIGTEDYVALMIGVTNDGYFNSNGDYAVFDIPTYPAPVYESYVNWLGTWTITGQTSSGTSRTYTLTIDRAMPNQTVIIKGWGDGGNYTADYQFLADFDPGTGALKLRNYPIRNSNFTGYSSDTYAVVLAGSTNNSGYAYYNNNYIATISKSGFSGATITPTTSYSGSYNATSMGFYFKYHNSTSMPAVIRSGNNSIQFATATMTKN